MTAKEELSLRLSGRARRESDGHRRSHRAHKRIATAIGSGGSHCAVKFSAPYKVDKRDYQDLAVFNLTGSLTNVVSNGSVGHGFRLWSKRDACANPCPRVWLGIDAQGSVHLGDSFSHANHPQSSTFSCIRYIESYALVTDLKFKLPAIFLQAHFKVLLTAVLHCIA